MGKIVPLNFWIFQGLLIFRGACLSRSGHVSHSVCLSDCHTLEVLTMLLPIPQDLRVPTSFSWILQVLTSSYTLVKVLTSSYKYLQVLKSSYKYLQVLKSSYKFLQVLTHSYTIVTQYLVQIQCTQLNSLPQYEYFCYSKWYVDINAA